MGGGSLMTPLLILLFGVKPVVAVGTDLAYAAITKTAGGFLHLRKGTVQTNLAWWLALGSCPGAVLGVVLLERLGLEDVLLPLIAAALLVTGALVLLRALISNGAGERSTVPLEARRKIAAVLLGVSKAGVAIPAAVIVAVPRALGALAFLVLRNVKPSLIVRTDP